MSDMPAPTWLRRPPLALALIPMLVLLWAFTHRYNGFARDGELYAVQALARVHQNLAGDLYLQNTSQDKYTAFSPIYACLIGLIGLQRAELALFLTCTAGFLVAAWFMVRELSNAESAWAAAALLIVTIGYYGAYQIFSYSENYLTARSLAEALVAAALACHYGGRRILAASIALGSMFIHPLMTLPALLLLFYLWLPIGAALAFAVGGTLASALMAFAATVLPPGAQALTVMDPSWLEVVRERSQFLFLNYWTSTDWELNARPFVGLTLTMLVLPEPRIRHLCLAAMLVGTSGLAVAYIAGAIGPVALLLQGQAWRWVWITGFTSVALLAPTAAAAWKDARCGPLCAMLLILSWTYSEVDGLAAIEAALILWLVRGFIDVRGARYLTWAAAALAVIVVGSVLAECWTFAASAIPESGRESLVLGRVREMFSMGISGLLALGLLAYWLKTHQGPVTVGIAAAACVAGSAVALSGSLKQLSIIGTRADIDAFADWRGRIPATSSVLIIPTTKSAQFAWFTLDRPSYLSVDQSSGVVFSRATALEVRRRSQVLEPVSEPDWQILTHIELERTGARKSEPPPRPLTASALESICRDDALGFVIAKENVGFDALPHRHSGAFKNWNLYDCRRVRGEGPS
jgi:hypothetical protein